MAITWEQVAEIKNALDEEYGEHHDERHQLRQRWHGRWWNNTDDSPTLAATVEQLFQDLRVDSNEAGPDYKIVIPLAHSIAAKYQTFFAQLPMVRMHVDPPGTGKDRHNSTVKERTIRGTWAFQHQMIKANQRLTWYLPVMGDGFLGIRPDFENKICRAYVHSPEYAYPVWGTDQFGPDAFIFAWRKPVWEAKREFPQWRAGARNPKRLESVKRIFGRGGPDQDTAEIIEYHDNKQFWIWVDGQQVAGLEHNLGFNLFDQVQFMNVPGEAFGHGAIEQILSLNEVSNALISLIFQNVLENVFPPLVVEDPQKMPEVFERGAGAVITTNPGGRASYLTPPAGVLQAQVGFNQYLEQIQKNTSGMPDVSFGQSDASIITGAAVSELQGAGTGSMVEMVQQTGIGPGLASWNAKCLHLYKNAFDKGDKFKFFGVQPRSFSDMSGEMFSFEIGGKDIKGGLNNEVVYGPHLNLHEKVVMNLQLKGAGVVSDSYVMEQVGIGDSEAMNTEIASEAIQKALIAAVAQSIQDPSALESGEQDVIRLVEGRAVAAGGSAGGSPSPPVGAPPGAPPGLTPAGPGGAPPPGIGGPAEPAGPQSGLSPLDQAQLGPGGEAPEEGAITIDEVVPAFQGVTGIKGRVFLVGEIVLSGQTTTDVEVAVTERSDREQLGTQLPQFNGLLDVRHVREEPEEAWLEVTPGTEPTEGGGDIEIEGIFDGEEPE